MNRAFRFILSPSILDRVYLHPRRIQSHTTIRQLIEHKYFYELLPLRSGKYLEAIENEPFSVYLGIDPSAHSLQLGNLVALMGLLRCHTIGKNGLVVLGTSTVCIGDPSGRTKKRHLDVSENYLANADCIEEQIQKIYQNYQEQFYSKFSSVKEKPSLEILRNSDWLLRENMMTFLMDITTHFRMTELLDKESVSLRLNSGNGMDLSEFLYPILQAMDFLYLYENLNCQIQIGGHDQLGNISCGLNLIHRKTKRYAFGKLNRWLVLFVSGLTVPLLTTPNGQKLGKSVSAPGMKPIWLDPKRTLPYSFYQRVLNLPDSFVSEQLLKQLTFFSSDHIKSLLDENQKSRDDRPVQRALARELTLLVHGVDGLQSAELATRIFFPLAANLTTDIRPPASQDVIATQLSTTEKNYLLQCVSPSAHLLPVIHTTDPPSISDQGALIGWFSHILKRTGTDSFQEDVIFEQASKGVTLNDVPIFPPGSASGQVALEMLEQNPSVWTELAPRLTKALTSVFSNLGLHVLKIGKLLNHRAIS
ncbi:Tyrosine--tRNA ligase [Fasciolopsis buskii]|uniref:Tyrosine--tRNA ligase n=1 Tax=Fasciolopsis buskii TaxID=27845 RepID=A0A8E0RK22_9TREM|nr:Tyrosine--tRNA ligase [Fasciolopsis buski]